MSKITELVEKHERLRERGVNLIASENRLSGRVRDVLASDLAGRYHSDYYGGTEPAQDILEKTRELACELFDVEHAIIKPISGNICDLDVLFSFTEPYDKIAMMDFENGGYPLGLEKFDRRRVSLPVEEHTYEIDTEESKKFYEKEDINMTILGSSYIPFPHPVEEVDDYREECMTPSQLVFDGSHVLGLIATGAFQDPLKEGADVLIGSTHKSFYGPQGGLVLTNNDEYAEKLKEYIDISLDTGIGLVDNPHPNRIAALGAAMEEMLEDDDYGEKVVRNAKALAEALDDNGLPMKFAEKGYTSSHQIFLDMEWEKSEEFCRELEKEDIFIDISGRIGVAEVTHDGLDETDMNNIADSISKIYKKI